LRISECLALKWSDVDWLNGKLSVQRGIVRQRVDDVKTAYSQKAMSIDSTILDLLKVWKQTSQFFTPDDWVFASPAHLGRLPWSADAVNDAYKKASLAAKIDHVSTHSIRHYAESGTMPHRVLSKRGSACKTAANAVSLFGTHAA
jgi:integrase